MIALTALNFEQQAILALFRHGDDKRLGALVPCVQIAMQRVALLRDCPASHEFTDHDSDIPAGLVGILHPHNCQHILIFV